jgi:murein DD-endopeptidase MepM/ murein hydrolase activator NlpD
MATPWWQMPISQAFNPPVEPGQDIATPFHTPITDLVPGVVKSMGYGPWGGRIDVMQTGAGGGNIVEYYQHLDEIAPGLKVGSFVTAGQFLGSSGGQLAGGEHPVQNAPDFTYSTGPHIEVGMTRDGQAVDPSALIAGGPQGGTGSGPVTSDSSLGSFGFTGTKITFPGGSIQTPSLSLPNPVDVVQAPFKNLWGWLTGGFNPPAGKSSAGSQLAPAVIPLVIAAAIILVVLGTGDKDQQPAPPQIVPVPV